jgi:dimethylargininase
MAVITRRVPFVRRFAASVLSALAVAVIGLCGAVFLLVTAAIVGTNGADASTVAQLFGVFLGSAVIVFFAMAVFALVGAYSRWYIALMAGIVAALIGALLGTVLRVIVGGTAVTGTVFGQLLGTLLGSNITFEVLVVIATVTAGAVVYRRIAKEGFAPGDKRIALVRAPAANLADGLVTHIGQSTIDTDLADAQWDAYVAALTENDWDVVEVPAAETMADSVFVEDAVVLFGETAVITSPGAESRRGETAAVESSVRELGLRVERIDLPGTLDGGDVLKVGRTVYVGRGGRTNADGIRQLRAIVAKLGYTVIAVPLTRALHLKSAVTALPDGTVIGWAPVVDDTALFDRFLAMPEEPGAHVVVLAPDTVLMAASAPKSAALIADLGYRVVTVDISEFEKLEGCVTCLSVRVR